MRPANRRASLLSRVMARKGTGARYCRDCHGDGGQMIKGRWVPCHCTHGHGKAAMERHLMSLPMPDFAADDDAWRAQRGLPPYQPQGDRSDDR